MSGINTEREGKVTASVVRIDGVLLRLEAAEALRSIAGEPVRPVKAAIGRAAMFVSRWWPMTDSRAEDIWRLEARRIDAEEMDAIRAAAAERRRLKEARDIDQIRDALTVAAERLRVADEEFHREEIALFERAAGAFRGVGGPVAGEGEG